MSKSRSVTSLEHRAPIYIDPRGGYVDITQPRGDRTKYTPAEARRLAAEILAAADEVEADQALER
ncbi:hypothetical protein [Haloglomus salinum]|jgi:hypothetical protein|uniref:hypothetical protein n=1 Tax=Haloglomus salinum TaxID=2962673 RepID=UPI0020CA0DA5|nr:hypothetical protein [Haloglomus salinum]